jgi:hypothetical protein
MRQEDFESYLEHDIYEYAEEHVRNGNWKKEEAKAEVHECRVGGVTCFWRQPQGSRVIQENGVSKH